MKDIFLPHLRKTVKLGGRTPAPAGLKRLKFGDYVTPTLPAPPASCDYSAAGQPGLSNVFMNDQLGCCVIAGGAHVTALATGNAGAEFIYTDAEIVSQYSAIGGYVPGDSSTDQGCNEETAFQWWQANGFANGTKLAGYLQLDPTNQTQVQQAMDLFENLVFGVTLPDAWISPFPSAPGFVWDVGTPDFNNGHCFIGVGYNAQGVQIDTWGLIGTITWAAVANQCVDGSGGQLFTLLTPDAISKATGKAASGFDFATLQTDLQVLDPRGGFTTVQP